MGRKLGPKCKQCRREGKKLFLKSDRCLTQKCAIVRRNYAPGAHGIKSKTRLTPYGVQLREKQKTKRIYGILEKQFSNYYKKAIAKTGDTGEIMFQLLELRLDNVVFRMGFAGSRNIARQLVSHGHILVNGKNVNIPSYEAKIGDVISIKEKSAALPQFKNLAEKIKREDMVGWISSDPKILQGKVVARPTREDLKEAFDLKLIIEYYSR
jgi:small subunit ribosomal protein S4